MVVFVGHDKFQFGGARFFWGVVVCKKSKSEREMMEFNVETSGDMQRVDGSSKFPPIYRQHQSFLTPKW